MEVISVSGGGDAETAEVLADLIRDSLRILLQVTVTAAWLWLAQVIVADRPYLTWAYAVLALLVATAVVSYRLQQRRLDAAVGVYLFGLVVAVTTVAWALPGTGVLYLYLLVALVAAVLTNPRITWSVTLLALSLVVITGRGAHRALPGELVSVVLFIVLAALTAWLSSRRLFTALGWALSMTKAAQRNAQDARARRAEVRSILKSLDEAYARLQRTNEALILAREAAERAYRFKAEFVANVSHELRTPLNLIVGFSEMMATAPESYKGRRLPSQYRGDVMAIYRSARHLSDLVDDVLDLSQIEAGRLPLSRELADPGEIIREAAEMVRGLAQAKGLQLEVALPQAMPLLRLDRTRVRQVLLNLLSNATRFTDQGWIRTRAWLEPGEVHISVADSGRGIAPEKLAEAFQAFNQLEDDPDRQGSGLGLAVSRKFVELHGGRMWIESTLGRGTTIGFALPVDDVKGTMPTLIRTMPAVRADGWPRVLVLHDDPHGLNLLHRYVDGVEFVPADSVEKAVEIAQRMPLLAAIVDDAWAERWVEVEGRANPPPPLALLTCPLPGQRRLGLLLGVADYLVKPVGRKELLAALSRLPRQPRKVLIVDDDPNFTRLMVRVLQAYDPAVSLLMASGGAEGLAVTRSQRPDLVLLDLLMPEVSGYDFLEGVKQDPSLEGMSVIILSARSLEEETMPLAGELRFKRPAGLAPGETLQAIQALLRVLTRPAEVAQANAAAPSADLPD